MKYTLKNISIGAALICSVAFTACNTDFLNTQPLSEVRGADVWRDANLAEAFLNEIYNGFGSAGFGEVMLSSATDESMFIHGYNMNKMVEASISATDGAFVTERSQFKWDEMYKRIRACNVFFSNIDNTPFDNPTTKDRLKGEAFFLRGYFYHQLVRAFGGVPLITKSYALGEADYTVARNTFEECVTFIVNDCDSAVFYLKGKQMAKGRTTEGAALALKSRILLCAASDLHDMPTAKAKSTDIAGFSNPELLGYVSGDRIARWTKAKNAAKAVMDLGRYSFQSPDPASAAEATLNYQQMFLKDNAETILSRYFTNNKDEDGGYLAKFNGLNGYHNWAGNVPTQSMIDDYEMSDGTAFSWNNAAQKAAPYQNRDPRFYATILYDGANWRPRPSDVTAKDPANQAQTGTYEVTDPTGKVVPYKGLDTRSSPIEDWNGTFTGYYLKKFIDPTIDAQYFNQEVPYCFFRYTEIVFNYIEACIELGEDGEARIWLNKIRKRAHMPDITVSGAALKLRYQQERHIEMAFEDHRFYDIRRWMIAPETVGRPLNGIIITAKFKPGKSAAIYKYDTNMYDYTYLPVVLAAETRKWVDKMYFMPIMRDEINRNNKLIQNPAY
jgi:hypothetical protein